MTEELEELDFVDIAPRMALRDYQVECLEKIRLGWLEASRLLVTLATGGGKTIIAAKEIEREVQDGGRVLFIAHTEELIDQAIDKLFRVTGIAADKEKAEHVASPHAKVVVASIQTLAKEARLRGFRDTHFTLVIVDECHRILAASYQRVTNYFHFGAQSLAPEWVAPQPGAPYIPKGKILGITATADRGDKRTLGEVFQKCVFEYGLLEAVRDGYLVRPIVKNIPLKIDLTKAKMSRISGQSDFDVSEVARRLSPMIDQIAVHIAEHAPDNKTVAFTPSIEIADMLARALRKLGVVADFVSGACDNRSEKIMAFDQGERGRVICCAMLLLEGWDAPSASCVCVLRPTRIRALFTQAVGRCTRTLPGVIDGLATAEERLAAIAASAKPQMTILDFLWLSDQLDLVRPVDLVASSPEIKKHVKNTPTMDLIEAAKAGKRDLLKSLEKAAKKVAHKKGRTMDPLAWAVSVGDAALAAWVPENKFDELPASPEQLKLLADNGIPTEKTMPRGLADRIITRILSRVNLKLCSPKQMKLLLDWGFPEEKAALMTQAHAGVIISRRFTR